MRFSDEQLATCQAMWESGVGAEVLAEEFGVTARTIKRHRARGKWTRDPDAMSDTMLARAKKKVEQRIDQFLQEEERAMKVAVAKTMNTARESVTEVLERHKDFTHRLANVMEREIATLETNPDSNASRRLTHIKTATDVVSSIQKQERKTWGIDDRVNSSDLDSILMEIEAEEDRRSDPGEEVN